MMRVRSAIRYGIFEKLAQRNETGKFPASQIGGSKL
jgi:hypothetical protein